jgi:hypothetical protein
MQGLLGFILGVVLTIAAAFAYDSVSGRAPNGLQPSSAGGAPPMVNWDVVGADWHGWELQMHNAGLQIQRGWKRLVG